jgi:hypothetical protein
VSDLACSSVSVSIVGSVSAVSVGVHISVVCIFF